MDMLSYMMGRSASGGGGGGLPTPTASDVGAGLVVKKVPVEGAVIVPEQMNEVFVPLTGVVESEIVGGQLVAGSYDSEQYSGYCASNSVIDMHAGLEMIEIYKDSENSAWYNGNSDETPRPITVRAVQTQFETIVPEQTVVVTVGSDALLQNVNSSLFTAGAYVRAIINGNACGSLINNGGSAEFEDENQPAAIYVDDGLHFWANEGEYTVKLEKATPVINYEWGIDPYAGYDVVIKLDKAIANNTILDSDLHLIKGSYADCVQKAHSGLPVKSCVYFLFDDESLQECTYISDIAVYENYGDYVEIVAHYPGSTITQYKTIYLTESGLALTAP